MFVGAASAGKSECATRDRMRAIVSFVRLRFAALERACRRRVQILGLHLELARLHPRVAIASIQKEPGPCSGCAITPVFAPSNYNDLTINKRETKSRARVKWKTRDPSRSLMLAANRVRGKGQ